MSNTRKTRRLGLSATFHKSYANRHRWSWLGCKPQRTGSGVVCCDGVEDTMNSTPIVSATKARSIIGRPGNLAGDISAMCRMWSHKKACRNGPGRVHLCRHPKECMCNSVTNLEPYRVPIESVAFARMPHGTELSKNAGCLSPDFRASGSHATAFLGFDSILACG